VADVARSLLDRWNSCLRALGDEFEHPSVEPPTVQNCWSWALKRWIISGGQLVIVISPRAHILRCCWAPEGDYGPLWHFEPTHPKRGLAGLWHAFLHEGKPKDLRNGAEPTAPNR